MIHLEMILIVFEVFHVSFKPDRWVRAPGRSGQRERHQDSAFPLPALLPFKLKTTNIRNGFHIPC